MHTYLRTHQVSGLEEVTSGLYRRSIAVENSRGIIEFSFPPRGDAIPVRLDLQDWKATATTLARCRHLLDLDTNPRSVMEVLARDPLLAPLIAARPGMRVWGAIDGFELTVRAILGQQVSVAGACTLLARVVARVGEPLGTPAGTVTHYFPTPEKLAAADLSGLGITGARIAALQGLARAVTEGTLCLQRGADTDVTVDALQALPGIGPWTTQYVAMRALGAGDAFPATDLGLRRALEAMGLSADRRSIATRAEAWRPWRAYALHYVWSTLPGYRPA